MEIAVVGATAVVRFDGSMIVDARVAITALAPTIGRVPAAEAAMAGGDGGREAAKSAARAIAEVSSPISDTRASSSYRTAMAEVIGRRAVEVAVRRASGEPVPIPASLLFDGGSVEGSSDA
jgi:carbon-monoxide dehydrogenase medium subunit